jgi:hypothetical protein
MRTYYKTPTRLQIINNLFRNNGLVTNNAHLEMDNTTNSRISGNTFIDDQSTPTTTYAVKEAATCSGNIIEGNCISGMKTAPLSLQSTSTARFNVGDGANPLAVIPHGADADYARPHGYGPVLWIGSVTPNNAATNDIYIPTV